MFETRQREIDVQKDGWNQSVWALVACIPYGKVASYGQVAAMLGFPRRSRHVGFALRVSTHEIPWFRVVNASGSISLPYLSEAYWKQRTLLETEGVVFRESGKISMQRFGWKP